MQSLTKSALDINCFYLAKEGADFFEIGSFF